MLKQGKELRWYGFVVSGTSEIVSRKSSLSKRSVMKAHQMPKHYIVGFFYTMRKDFPSLESYDGSKYFIFHCGDYE